MRSTISTILIIVGIAYAYKATLDEIFSPVPHKEQTSAAPGFLHGAGTTDVGAAAEVPVPGTAPRPPYIVELQREIEAREHQLDDLSQQLEATKAERNQANAYIQELANTLNSAIAERNEAIALLEQLGALNARPQL